MNKILSLLFISILFIYGNAQDNEVSADLEETSTEIVIEPSDSIDISKETLAVSSVRSDDIFYLDRPLLSLNDSLVEFGTEPKPFFQKEGVKMSIAPVALFAASGATWGVRKDVREMRNRYIPHFKVPYDDYLQYAPAVTVYGLKLAGVKGRNNTLRATYSYAASVGIMAILVNSIKYTAKVERPDGSSNNSFPSGHTANSFNNASFLHKEYGVVSPAYSIGAYSAATFTGFGRNLNNRHWISDVLAGAGIGILSTELGYFFIDKFYKNKGDNMGLFSQIEGDENPSFISLKAGYALATTNFLKQSELDSKKETGFEAGLEGAYFWNKHWGIGGNFSFTSFPVDKIRVDLDTEGIEGYEVDTQSLGYLNFTAGPYYAYEISEDWILMLKSMAGFSSGSSGKVTVEMENKEIFDEVIEVAEYKPSNSFRWTNGASMTYKFNEEIGITAYADYHLSNSKINYHFNEIFPDENEDMNARVKEKANYFTLGLKLTAFF